MVIWKVFSFPIKEVPIKLKWRGAYFLKRLIFKRSQVLYNRTIRKMSWGCMRSYPLFSRLKLAKVKDFVLRSPRHWAAKWLPWGFVHSDSSHTAQIFRHLKASIAKIQEGPTTVLLGNRTWLQPHGAELADVQNMCKGPRKLPLRFQKMAWEARLCTPKKLSIKLKVQWRPQELGDARNMEHPRKP